MTTRYCSLGTLIRVNNVAGISNVYDLMMSGLSIRTVFIFYVIEALMDIRTEGKGSVVM